MASALEDLSVGGVFTGGLYASLNSLRDVLSQEEVDAGRVYAFFDHSPPPFRRALFPNYKLGRVAPRMLDPETYERAKEQIRHAFALWPTLGIACMRYVEREADDAIGAAVMEFSARKIRPVIVSGDRDMFQFADVADIWFLSKEPYLVCPDDWPTDLCPRDQYRLFRALVGDASDGLTGVKGCGPAGALKILAETKATTLDELRQALPKLKQSHVVQQVAASAEVIERMLKVMDLRKSFGNRRGLVERLDTPATLDQRAFVAQCKQWSFKSIYLGDVQSFLVPFRRCLA